MWTAWIGLSVWIMVAMMEDSYSFVQPCLYLDDGWWLLVEAVSILNGCGLRCFRFQVPVDRWSMVDACVAFSHHCRVERRGLSLYFLFFRSFTATRIMALSIFRQQADRPTILKSNASLSFGLQSAGWWRWNNNKYDTYGGHILKHIS